MTARLGSRAWVLCGVAAGVLILAAAWLLVISPVRSDASALRDDTASVQTQNVVIQAQNNKLRDQAKRKKELVAELQSALNGLPSGAGLPVLSRQLATQAAAHSLTLTGVAIGTPVSPTTATTAPADPTSTDPAAAPSAAGAVTTMDATTPLAIPITITTDGPALQQLLFLRDVQHVGPRLALVTSTALAPSTGADQAASIDTGATMTLQITVFTNPLPKATRDQLAKLTGDASTGSSKKN